ncbi:MAG: T9SS type A sorting domain-containing protein [Bacteroidia bacterium]
MKKILLTQALMIFSLVFSFAQTYNIGHTTIVFNDAARGNRNIQTEVFYPAANAGENVPFAGVAGQQFPVVVFGHGLGMIYSAYESIWQSIVAQGYIIAFPKTESSLTPDQANFAKDLAFLVNAIQGQSSMQGTLFTGKVNTKSCVMGHDIGGACALIAGQYNPNITTIASLAPSETDPSAVASAPGISQASIIIAGGNDCVAPAASNSTAIYNALGANCKTFISITGGSHCQFANYNSNCNADESTCTPSPSVSRAMQQKITMRFLLPWLSYKLKNDCHAWFIFKEDLETAIDVTYQQACDNPVLCINPAGKKTTDININSAKLRWRNVNCVSTYELRYKLSSSPVWINVGTVGTVTSYNLTNLQIGISYDWAVRTVCDDDATLNSGWGTKKTFATASAKDGGYEVYSPEENEFLINPNPSNGKFQVTSVLNDFTPLSIQVYNCIGKKVVESSIKPKEQDLAFAIDISNEPSGIYFVRINCGEQINTQRIIKR